MPEEHQSSTGSSLDPKLSALLAYLLLPPIGGIIFYLTSKDSFVKFHAMQSIMTSFAVIIIFIGFSILGFLIYFAWGLVWILNLAAFALWVLLMIKSYQGERYKLPIIGDMAEKYAK